MSPQAMPNKSRLSTIRNITSAIVSFRKATIRTMSRHTAAAFSHFTIGASCHDIFEHGTIGKLPFAENLSMDVPIR